MIKDRSGFEIDIYKPTIRSPSIVKRLNGYPNPDVCWEWTGYIHPSGYGRVHSQQVHRVVYEAMVKPITEETLDHLCRNPICCNPKHLEPVSRSENVRRERRDNPQGNQV